MTWLTDLIEQHAEMSIIKPTRKYPQQPEVKEIDGITYKQCHWCNEFKLLTEFYINHGYKDYLQPYCKTCYSKYYKKRNTKEKNRIDNLKRYNLTTEEYNFLYKLQEGKCAICEKPEEILNIDHCHLSNRNRGLLCQRCNFGLGNFNDDIELFHKAISYLFKYSI